jgi:hypothetical protein
MNHYRNYNSYIPETSGIRTTNTLGFFPEKVEMPTTSTADRLARAAEASRNSTTTTSDNTISTTRNNSK